MHFPLTVEIRTVLVSPVSPGVTILLYHRGVTILLYHRGDRMYSGGSDCLLRADRTRRLYCLAPDGSSL